MYMPPQKRGCWCLTTIFILLTSVEVLPGKLLIQLKILSVAQTAFALLQKQESFAGLTRNVSFSKHLILIGFAIMRPEAFPREKLWDCSSLFLCKQVPCQELSDFTKPASYPYPSRGRKGLRPIASYPLFIWQRRG